MSQRSKKSTSGVKTQVGTALLLVIIFALIGFVALSVVTGNDFGVGSGFGPANSLARASDGPQSPLGTVDPAAMIDFKQTALGFRLEYPRSWRKREEGLRVILSPSAKGLDLADRQDAAMWLGIPADNTVDPLELLRRTVDELAPGQPLRPRPMSIGAETWQSTQIEFSDEGLGPATATIAATSKNEVGYYLVAVAPTGDWEKFQPVFNNTMRSFQFTTEAVLRPTDATPPPTPTPTPTPVFYIVQSGDTPSHIAAQYGVSVEALMTRNGIDDPRSLRTGAKLIIPRQRRR